MKKHTQNPILVMLAISAGMTILYLIFRKEGFVYASLIIALTGLLSPWLSRKIAFVWMTVAGVINRILTTVLLSLVFYLILFPLAFFSKLFGKKDDLQLKDKPDSMYVNRETTFDKASFEKTW